ncbi:hypothetical protein KIN20_019181 [Parelaphostrongylus tenuis]|uniref:Uncharacterized protein n=1 Tax=Parelaphostrongylus tenuis TaxID=148309 RepID=A0AAD5N8D9_PARTN|nr:hypothetical protein KIN20_019181 [Parelaphostrongylus tenuis]
MNGADISEYSSYTYLSREVNMINDIRSEISNENERLSQENMGKEGIQPQLDQTLKKAKSTETSAIMIIKPRLNSSRKRRIVDRHRR